MAAAHYLYVFVWPTDLLRTPVAYAQRLSGLSCWVTSFNGDCGAFILCRHPNHIAWMQLSNWHFTMPRSQVGWGANTPPLCKHTATRLLHTGANTPPLDCVRVGRVGGADDAGGGRFAVHSTCAPQVPWGGGRENHYVGAQEQKRASYQRCGSWTCQAARPCQAAPSYCSFHLQWNRVSAIRPGECRSSRQQHSQGCICSLGDAAACCYIVEGQCCDVCQVWAGAFLRAGHPA